MITHIHTVTICHSSCQTQGRFTHNADSSPACLYECLWWKTQTSNLHFSIFNINKFSCYVFMKLLLIPPTDCKELTKSCFLYPFRVMMQGQLWQQPCWGLQGPNLKPEATALCLVEEGLWRRWAPYWPGGRTILHVIVSLNGSQVRH